MTVLLVILLLIALLVMGVPVAFSLGISGAVGLFIVNDFSAVLSIFATTPHTTVASYTLTTIPMFILMAELASKGTLATQLFTVTNRFVGHVPGGVAISTVIASAGFGAMSGSSSAATAAMSRIAIPEMIRGGYRPRVAAGVVAASGTLAIMIPPSIPMLVYGITTETSVGKLLIAGIFPGLLTAAIYSLGILGWTKFSAGSMPTGDRYTWKERLDSLKGVLPFIILVLAVIGGMYTGIATPTEVAAIGALMTLVICIVMRSIDLKGFVNALKNAILLSVMILAIMIGAMVFGYFLTAVQAAQNAIGFIEAAGLPGWLVLASLFILYLVLGCFLDTISILLITLPLTFPLATGLGYDGIWFGVIVVKLIEIGLLTPPVGMNVYVTSGVSGIPLEEVFKGVSVMLLFEAATFVLLISFPAISLFLPSLMK